MGKDICFSALRSVAWRKLASRSAEYLADGYDTANVLTDGFDCTVSFVHSRHKDRTATLRACFSDGTLSVYHGKRLVGVI